MDVFYPTSFKTIMRFQQKHKSLMDFAKEKPKVYFIKQFHGAFKMYSLIYRQGQIVISYNLLLNYTILGETRTKFNLA